MVKVNIHYVQGNVYTTIESPERDFVGFCEEIFKSKFYISLSDKSLSIAINIDNIIYIEEVKE